MKRTTTDEMILEQYHEMTGNEKEAWKKIFSLTEKERSLFLDVMELTIDHPARHEYAAAWTGKLVDLPALLRNIN